MKWFLRQQADDMAADDWLAFSDWLGEDADHAAAFDAVVAADGRLDGLDADRLVGSAAETAGDFDAADEGSGRRLLWWAVASIAAVLILAVLVWPRGGPVRFEAVATAPGESRSLALADTVRIEMNGATRLTYARGHHPVVRLETGEAAFYITSREPSKLRVEVGGLVLTDKGTSFDVIRDRFGTRVAVGSGRVRAESGSEVIELAAGQGLVRPASGGAMSIARILPADMAGWRSGTLAFRDAPLALVVSDLGRALGAEVVLGPELSQRRFTGVLPLAGSPEEAVSGAAALFGAQARRKGEGWEIVRR